jgi:hypothetical protein
MFRHRLDVKYGQSAQGNCESPPTKELSARRFPRPMPVRVPDVTLDSRYIMVNPETRSELAIPMIHKGASSACSTWKARRSIISPRITSRRSRSCGAPGRVARKCAAVRKAGPDEARMERELTAAQRLQNALLRPVPSADYGLDITARILSAREVCGDLYDFLPYGTQQLGIALGDVSGKGSAAALYGAVATGILRSLSPHKLQPAELLRQLNQLVCDRRVEGRYMTICFATWQKARRKLRVANAGQSQPLLWKDGHVEQINLTGFPIGIFDDATYEEWSVRLNTGDILLFYSDGITEASNREGKFFGTGRIEGSSGRQRAFEFERTCRPLARGSAGIHAGRRHHGRSHAGGDESQVSAASSHSRASRSAHVVDPARYTPGFSYRGSQLYCEGVSVAAAAKRFGTPMYLYSRASIEQAYRRMDAAFGALPHTICYAMKANSNLSILRIFAALGSGFDIVSGGELYRLRKIGVPGSRIVFSGVGKSREEIREALRARILLFNVESAAELDLLASEASRLCVRAAASIRVNPDVDRRRPSPHFHRTPSPQIWN